LAAPPKDARRRSRLIELLRSHHHHGERLRFRYYLAGRRHHGNHVRNARVGLDCIVEPGIVI
jgi:hypothetical protein